jgi:hypothetical protein
MIHSSHWISASGRGGWRQLLRRFHARHRHIRDALLRHLHWRFARHLRRRAAFLRLLHGGVPPVLSE